jgi:glycerol kinase
MSVILALDQGTTSSRAIVFDTAGAILAVAQKEFTQVFPRPGWVEHDPEEIWATQIAVAHEALARARIHARDVAAIGVANQRETTVVWDRASGRALCNAIVWQDRRTAAACDALKAGGFEARVAAKTGLVLDAYFSGTKLGWILDNVPGARARAEAGQLAFGTIDSWLIWKLSAGSARDRCQQPRTLLDITGKWDDGCSNIRVPAAPPVRRRRVWPNGGGLSAPAPVAGIAGDQQAALFGNAACAGHDQNTRHGLLHADAHGRDARAFAQQASDGGGVRRRRCARVRPRGQGFHRRRGGSVAARRARHHPEIRGCRSAGQ